MDYLDEHKAGRYRASPNRHQGDINRQTIHLSDADPCSNKPGQLCPMEFGRRAGLA
jgi:hypothetical protein